MIKSGVDDVFFPPVRVLESGERIALPVFSLAREHRVRSLIIEAFDPMPPEAQDQLFTNFFSPQTLKAFFLNNPTLWVVLGAEVYDRPEAWVREHCTLAEIFGEAMSLLLPTKVDAEAKPAAAKPKVVWSMARVLDFLMHEYKWTLEQALSHSREQIDALMEACNERYTEQNKASQGKKPSGSRYPEHPGSSSVDPATPADLGNDGGLSSVRAFARRNNVPIKKA